MQIRGTFKSYNVRYVHMHCVKPGTILLLGAVRFGLGIAQALENGKIVFTANAVNTKMETKSITYPKINLSEYVFTYTILTS